MKNAFTMIELIFVIVILGILAAVAIPKLSATRDDAKITKEITNVQQIISNAAAEYTAKGQFSSYADTDCFHFVANSDGNFTVSHKSNPSSFCNKLYSSDLYKNTDINGTHYFGGTKVKY